ncbi:MAG TPA: histidine phosphatase family protein [Acidimicrobiia bacterium]
MPPEIVLVRHAETTANRTRVWQGSTNAPFSPEGEVQLERLRLRFASERFDIVASSDLGRAEATAAAMGLVPEVDPRWREPNIGSWEGLTFEQISEREPERIRRLLAGDDVELGGGERLTDTAVRLGNALGDLVRRVGESGRALVVSHGLAILTLASQLLGTSRPAPLALPFNTAVVTLTPDPHGIRLVRYNDSTHLLPDHVPMPSDQETHLILIRHGETVANIEGRWQGHQPGELTERGSRQIRSVGAHLPRLDAIYSSPLARAVHTAEAVADSLSMQPVQVEDLKEIGFGSWEGLTVDEIGERDPEGLALLRAGDEHVIRGGSGEAFAGVRQRVTTAIDEIAANHRGQTVGIVSHGGALRAFASGLLGMGPANRHRLASMDNTAFSRVVYSANGRRLVDWNLAPHFVA